MVDWPRLRRGDEAAGEAGGVLRREDARLAQRRDRPAVPRRVLAEERARARRLPRADVRVPLQRVRRQRPQRVRRRRRAVHQVRERVKLLTVKAIDIHQLLRERVPTQLRAVLQDPLRVPRPNPRQVVQRRRVRAVQINLRNVDEPLQPPVHRVRHDERFREIRLPAKSSPARPVPVDCRRLFLAETQTDKILHRHRIRIEPKTLHPPRLLPVRLHVLRMRRVPACDSARLCPRNRPGTKAIRERRKSRNRLTFRRLIIRAPELFLRVFVIDIHRIRPIPIRLQPHLRCTGDEQRRLVPDDQKGQGNRPHLEHRRRRLILLIIFHNKKDRTLQQEEVTLSGLIVALTR